MAAGLFYVYTDPGTVDEAEFHDWYDHEHGPARLTVPGLGPAYRYRALDELKPEWLALYELDSPDVIESPGTRRSARRRATGTGPSAPGWPPWTAECTSRSARTGPRWAGNPDPAPADPAVAMSVPEGSEDDLDAWYTEEHIPMLLKVPGWRRIRRFRLTRALDAPGPEGPAFLSVHELAGPEVLEDPGFLAAISTPWRDRGGLGVAAGAAGVRPAQRDRRLTG